MFETYAFAPVDQDKDQEEWPLLELTDATVFTYKRTGPAGLEDLLDVQDRGPFRIEGSLSRIPDEYRDIVRTKNSTKLYEEPLVVTTVMTYSIELCEDGEVKIWALGKCAWYSIIPSAKYRPIYKTMVEKGKLWLFLQDKYCDKYSGKGNNIRGKAEDLYVEYARAETSLPNALAAARLFEKHFRYLLCEMCSARADTEMWARTPLFRHLALKHAAELKSIRRSMAGAKENPASAKEASPTPSPSPSPTRESPPPSTRTPKVHNRSKTYLFLKFFYDYAKEHRLEPPEITKDLIIQFIYDSYVFDSLQHATANVHARAEELLAIMENPLSPIMYDWTETPAYKELGFVRTSENDAIIRQEKLVPRIPDSRSETDSITNTPAFIRSPPAPKGKSPARVPVLTSTPTLQKRVPDSSLPRTAKRPRTRGVPTLLPGTGKPPLSSTGVYSTRANRPGGHWECEISGCGHAVLDADTAENLRAIEEHYEEHAEVIRQAMDAIGGGTGLQGHGRHVDNLLAKLEAMAEKWAISKPGLGRVGGGRAG